MIELQAEKDFTQKLKSVITFRFLSDSELLSLLPYASFQKLSPGEVVVKEGDISPYLFGILSGSMSVEVTEREDRQVYVCTLGSGDVFGEAGIFVSVKRTASVKALEESVLIRIHRKDLVRFIKNFPGAGNKILMVIIHGLLRKLRQVNHELAFERKSDMEQEDIDALVSNIFAEEE